MARAGGGEGSAEAQAQRLREVKEKAERGTLQNQIIKLLQQRKDDLELVTNAV